MGKMQFNYQFDKRTKNAEVIIKYGKIRNNIIWDIIKNPTSYLLALPAILYTFIFGYMTYPYMIIAFERFDYKKGVLSPFNGLQNFEFFFRSSDVFRVTYNTIKLNLLFIVFGTLAALVLAIVLNELKSKLFLRINQSIMLLPYYLSWVVVSYMLYSLFSTDYGVIDQALKALGMKSINWYLNASWWPTILTIMNVWKGAGISAVIYLAAIAGIDGTVYEAAQIDGANRWQQCKSITIPLIMPTVMILTLLAVGRIMYGNFGMLYALVGDNGVLYPTTDIIDTYIFRALRLTGNPSQAMAMGLFQSAIGFIMVFGSNWITRKFYPEGAIY
jgi:putative aldouronate transport system permease protein